MSYCSSSDDQEFRTSVEQCSIAVAEFDHRAHLRLAYIYLVESEVDAANDQVRAALNGLLRHNNIEPTAKYHETLTRAWLLAVRHLMNRGRGASSAGQFIDDNPVLLDSKAMLTHYSEQRLFSDAARKAFLPPDLEPIPTIERRQD